MENKPLHDLKGVKTQNIYTHYTKGPWAKTELTTYLAKARKVYTLTIQ